MVTWVIWLIRGSYFIGDGLLGLYDGFSNFLYVFDFKALILFFLSLKGTTPIKFRNITMLYKAYLQP